MNKKAKLGRELLVSKKEVRVKEHRRKNGTVVEEHIRRIKEGAKDAVTREKKTLKEGEKAKGFRNDDKLSSAEATLAAVFGYLAVTTAVAALMRYGLPRTWMANKASTFEDAFETVRRYDGVAHPSGVQAARKGSPPPDNGSFMFEPGRFRNLEGTSKAETLNNVESWMRGMTKEHGFVIDDGGKIMAAFRGSGNNVPAVMPMKMSRAERHKLVFTHNHPVDTPLSIADVSVLDSLGVGEMRAVLNGTGQVSTLQMKRGVTTLNPAVRADVIWSIQSAMKKTTKPMKQILSEDEYMRVATDTADKALYQKAIYTKASNGRSYFDEMDGYLTRLARRHPGALKYQLLDEGTVPARKAGFDANGVPGFGDDFVEFSTRAAPPRTSTSRTTVGDQLKDDLTSIFEEFTRNTGIGQ